MGLFRFQHESMKLITLKECESVRDERDLEHLASGLH